MVIPGFIGGSYALESLSSDIQRAINLYPSLIESGSGEGPARMRQIPGLSRFASLGAEIRALYETNGRLFAAAGSTLYELDRAAASTAYGTLVTSTGPVDMAANTTQLIIVDGGYGYTKTLTSGSAARITSSAFYGSNRVGFIDGYALFNRPDTGQFYATAINDAQSLDANDYATAEASPDNLISLLVDHREVWLFGRDTTEIWVDNPNGADFPFERMQSAFIEVGCIAPFSAQKIDETVIWLSKEGVVWMAQGYRPKPISDEFVCKKLQALTDLSGARAFTLRIDDHPMYAFNVDGLDTTLVYDIATQKWHEWAELVDGEYTPHRATCYAFAFGKHLVGDADGNVYQLDPEANDNDGDVLVRDRIFYQPQQKQGWEFYSALEIEADTGKGKPDGTAPSIQMRYSNDKGATFTDFRTVSMGAIGERFARAVFGRSNLGRARGGRRVWHIRFTDDSAFSPVSASVEVS